MTRSTAKTLPAETANRMAQAFLEAWGAGRACLHPTDTIPGLTFDPRRDEGRIAVSDFKGRPDTKPYLGLLNSFEKAQKYFVPLPPAWHSALQRLWPGPLSVVWQASQLAPPSMVSADGTIGLRVPALHELPAWFRAVLDELDVPLPTTSVNLSGKLPANRWDHAVRVLRSAPAIFVPEEPVDAAVGRPSTLIRIVGDGSCNVLRQGAMSTEFILKAFDAPESHH